jgi:hypothetical protein
MLSGGGWVEEKYRIIPSLRENYVLFVPHLTVSPSRRAALATVHLVEQRGHLRGDNFLWSE